MARRPLPSYAIDGESIYIPESDTAWDWDRVEAERKDYEEGQHPVDLYHQGATRCRLESVQEYLDMSKDPEKWTLKEVPARVSIEIQSLLAQAIRMWEEVEKQPEVLALIARANLLAFKHGVARVENSPFEVKRSLTDGSIKDETINGIERVDPGLVGNIGHMIRASFRPLDEAEGK